MKEIGKITAKLVLGALLTKPDENTRVEAIRIQGRVDRVKISPSSFNPENMDVKLTGEFVATNCETGEVFKSATLYPMGAAMTDAMSVAPVGSLFACRVYLVPSSKAPKGYAFDYESAINVEPSEAVARLGDAFLALPAPSNKHKK